MTLFVTERGASRLGGSALVFLHYFGGSSRAWNGVIEILADRHRCCALDLPGFGASPPLAGDVTVDDVASSVANTLTELRLESYTLVGHSMGAKIAWALASRRQVGCESLVLLAPSPPTPEPIPDEERARLLRGFGNRLTAEETARKVVGHPLSATDHDSIVGDALRTSREGWEWWLQRGSREDMAQRAPQIDVPTLVVAGELDEPLSPAYIKAMVADKIPDARMEVIPGARHLLPIEAPDDVAGLIAARCARPSSFLS